jgi:hypothetical protein
MLQEDKRIPGPDDGPSELSAREIELIKLQMIGVNFVAQYPYF